MSVLNGMPPYRVSLDGVGNGDGALGYGGRIEAYSFVEYDAKEWLAQFAADLQQAKGRQYLPVYRMADGEYRFMFGPRVNWRSRPGRQLFSYWKSQLNRKLLGRGWQTSWGEVYSVGDAKRLSEEMWPRIREVSEKGRLALYWNENGINAFVEYNEVLSGLLKKRGIQLTEANYIPFHFPGALLLGEQGTELWRNSRVLLISGMGAEEFTQFERNAVALGARTVELYQISATQSMLESLDFSNLSEQPDFVLTAAGIGSINVLSQCESLNCPVLDIGGVVHCISGTLSQAHGGFFRKVGDA